MPDSKYLIIGNSAAAVGAVEGIREVDPDGSITILSKEKEHAYSRPLISYLLGGKVDEAAMSYRPANFYDKNKASAVLGVSAQSVDAKAKKVSADDGQAYGYEELLIATGGRPITPPMAGADTPGVFTFTTWADARAIKAFIDENHVNSAVVVGGGLIGLKSVEALVAGGIKTTVVELADRVLSITLDNEASSLAQAALAEAGVELITNNTVDEIVSSGSRVGGVVLKDGRRVDCGLVILAIGVLPDTSLAVSAGAEAERGILVDEYMATSVPHVFAAGDAAQALEIISGERRSIPIWPLAYAQGRVAGLNMAGGDASYHGGLAMNSVEICGVATISAGLTTPEEEGYEILNQLDAEDNSYRKLVIKDGRLVGYVLVGRVERAGILTGLIQSGINVDSFKERMMDRDFGLINLPEQYSAGVLAGKGAAA